MKNIRFLAVITLASLFALVQSHAQALNLNLQYEGAWTNLTFSSTGAAHVGVVINGASATINFDLDGFVFGAADPPLIVVPGVINNGVLQLDSKGLSTYGDVAGSINLATGDTLIDLTNVPNPRIAHLKLTGKVTAGGAGGPAGKIDLQYLVDFPPGSFPSTATGVLVATQIAPVQITSIETGTGELIVSWTGGKPPYQIQTTASIGASTLWRNSGTPTSSTTAHVPLAGASRLFVRIAD
jgi:hypothetical protein